MGKGPSVWSRKEGPFHRSIRLLMGSTGQGEGTGNSRNITGDAPVQGTPLLFWAFFRERRWRENFRPPAWRGAVMSLGCFSPLGPAGQERGRLRRSRGSAPWRRCPRRGRKKGGSPSGRGREELPLKACWERERSLRLRRRGFRTRRAGPADHASCLRADRPCGRGAPDIAPDPSPVPRAPAAGRRPGACPGAAAGRDGR